MMQNVTRNAGLWTVVSILAGTLVWSGGSAFGQSATKSVPPDGPAQMAVLYAHGFNDDGAAWGTGEIEPWWLLLSQARSRYQNNTNTPSRWLAHYGIESYAVQWSAASPNEYADPYATAEEGFAWLADEAQMKRETDWIGGTLALHNRARPSFMDVLATPIMDVVTPAYAPFEAVLTLPWTVWALPPPVDVVQSGRKAFYLIATANRNTYNDSGTVEDQAINFLDLLRDERESGERLGDYRQVNIVTHSKGSLTTRAMLAMAEEASREDAEYVANVVYNAPPFAGSSLTELLKMLYDPPVFLRSHLANPWLAQTWDELFFTFDLPNPRLGDHVRALLRAMGAAFGADWDAIEANDPNIRNQIDLLNVFETEAAILATLATAPPTTTAGRAGIGLAGLLNTVRPVMTAAMGIPSFPTAREDLPPEEGANFLGAFPNSTNQAQFVNIGLSSPLFSLARTALWPPQSYAAVAATPSLIYDVGSLVGTSNDTYVAYESAAILTQTDAFGPRYTLHGVFPTLDHGGMIMEMPLLATNWLSVFLAPPTTMHMSGSIETVSDADRIYRVTPVTLFSFESANFSTNVGTFAIAVAASTHQYRFIPRYADNAEPSPWASMSPGSSNTFGSALSAVGLGDEPVYMQWRSLQPNGAKEMIRQATIVMAGDPPQVVNTDMLGFANEIVRQAPARQGFGPAIRSGFFEKLPHRTADLLAIRAGPAPEWILRNQSGKAFVAIFDKVGSVDYAWNDPSMSSFARRENVNALFLELAALSDGVHTLTFEPFTQVGAIENRGPRQTVRILIDNTPPEHSFAGRVVDAIGFRVGPGTPLIYRCHDLESGGASGSIHVIGFTNTTFASGQPFRLGETDLIDQIKSAPGGSALVGGFITFQAAATDRVGNVSTTNFQAYFDFTPPTLTNLTAVGGLPVDGGFRVFTNVVDLRVDVRDPNTSEYSAPLASFVNADTDEAGTSDPFVFDQTVGAFARYTGSVAIALGTNVLQVGSEDVYGNLAVAPLLLIYDRPDAFDTLPLTVLSPRIDDVTSDFYDEEGNPTNITVGAIQSVASSWDGSRFVFQSSGNAFVPGDSNQRADIFLSEGGRIRRVNTGPNGEQALGGDSQNPAISGDGRYVYFRSRATNLVAGTTTWNLYVKEVDTGRIAVISRHFNGNPINRATNTGLNMAPTHNGRYVFFDSPAASYVNGLTLGNNSRDIYMVDLDPDGNGDYFDDNYVTYAISTVTPTLTGNDLSRSPSISGDGRYLVFITQATDLHPDLAATGSTRHGMMMKFPGNSEAGTLHVGLTNRLMYVVNRESLAGGAVLAEGIEDIAVAPDGDTAVFRSRGNVNFTGDTNLTSTGMDVYTSIGERFGTASISNRIISWQSRGVGNTQSSVPAVNGWGQLTVSADLRPAAFHNNKIAWVSEHNNLISGDNNSVADLFLGTAGTLGVMSLNPPSPNWIASNIVSGAAVLDGGLTPCGRYAWWVSQQEYVAPYSPTGRQHLYLRRIDPPITNELNLTQSGEGTILSMPLGNVAPTGTTEYLDTDRLLFAAAPATGWRFTEWQGADRVEEGVAEVSMVTNRSLQATFVAAVPPTVAPLTITTLQNQASAPVAPVITDPDPDEQHTLSIVGPPAKGTVQILGDAFVYTPNPNTHGDDTFTFQVTDAYGLTLAAPATADVVVLPVNTPPSVSSLTLDIFESAQAGPFMPDVIDPDEGDAFTLSIVTQPTHGAAAADANGLYYTPDAGFTGSDSFTFRVTDLAGDSATAQVLVNVIPLPVIAGVDLQIGPGIFGFGVSNLPPNIGYTVEFNTNLVTGIWAPVPPTNQWPAIEGTFEDLPVEPWKTYRLRFEALP